MKRDNRSERSIQLVPVNFFDKYHAQSIVLKIQPIKTMQIFTLLFC